MSEPVDLDMLERLEKAAAPGPWIEIEDKGMWSAGKGLLTDIWEHRNLSLTVAARNALPTLIREPREARAEIERMRAWIADVAKCRCDEAGTGRGLHATECLADEVPQEWIQEREKVAGSSRAQAPEQDAQAEAPGPASYKKGDDKHGM